MTSPWPASVYRTQITLARPFLVRLANSAIATFHCHGGVMGYTPVNLGLIDCVHRESQGVRSLLNTGARRNMNLSDASVNRIRRGGVVFSGTVLIS